MEQKIKEPGWIFPGADSAESENSNISASIKQENPDEKKVETIPTVVQEEYKKCLIEAKDNLIKCMCKVEVVVYNLYSEGLLDLRSLIYCLKRPMMQQKAEALFNHILAIPFENIHVCIWAMSSDRERDLDPNWSSAACISPLGATHLRSIYKKICSSHDFNKELLKAPPDDQWLMDMTDRDWDYDSEDTASSDSSSPSSDNFTEQCLNPGDVAIPMVPTEYSTRLSSIPENFQQSHKASEIIRDMKGNISNFKQALKSVKTIPDLVCYDDYFSSTLGACTCLFDQVDSCNAIAMVLERFKEIEKTQADSTDQIDESASSEDAINLLLTKDSPFSDEFLNHMDQDGDTILHNSIHFRDINSVRLLYRTYGADIFLENNAGKTALELMYEIMPEEVKWILDSSVMTYAKSCVAGKMIIGADFSAVLGRPGGTQDDNDDDTGSITCFMPKKEPKTDESELRFLNHVVNESSKRQRYFFNHPLIALFLMLQWMKYKQWILASAIMQIFLKIFYTLLVIQVFLVKCPHNANRGNTSNAGEGIPHNCTTEEGPIEECQVDSVWTVLAWILVSFAGFLILVEIMELYYKIATAIKLKLRGTDPRTRNTVIGFFTGLRNYFHQFENITQLICAGLIAYICVTILRKRLAISDYGIAAGSIVLGSVLVLMELGSFPWFSVYIQILFKVSKSFSKFLSLYAVLLVAFAIAFSIIFPGVNSYTTLGDSVPRILIMMAGEIEYKSVVHEDDEAIKMGLIGQTIFVSFVLIMAFILTNLLIGLVVSDVKELVEQAQIVTMSVTLEKCCTMESTLKLFYWRWMLLPLKTVLQFLDWLIFIIEKNAKGEHDVSSMETGLYELIPLYSRGPFHFQVQKLRSDNVIALSRLPESMQAKLEELLKKDPISYDAA